MDWLNFQKNERLLRLKSANGTASTIVANAGLDIGLVGPVARGASRFENLLAPQKTYWPEGPVDLKTYWPPKKLNWPPKKLTGPYLKTKLARRKTICINLQFAHRPIIKLFRSHPRNIFQIWMVILKIKINKKRGPVGNQLWPELARSPKKCVRASGHIANVKPWNVIGDISRNGRRSRAYAWLAYHDEKNANVTDFPNCIFLNGPKNHIHNGTKMILLCFFFVKLHIF